MKVLYLRDNIPTVPLYHVREGSPMILLSASHVPFSLFHRHQCVH